MEKNALQILSGAGLHSGRNARLELSLRTASSPSGPRFRFPRFGPLTPADLAIMPRSVLRATRLGSEETAVSTPEHLLAALLFFSWLPLEVVCDAPELPGLDGSALEFRDALARLAPAAAAAPAWKEYPSDLDWEHRWEYRDGIGAVRGRIRVRPSARFRVRWTLDRPPLRQTFSLEDAATAYREILPARTFAFHREWRDAAAQGLMAGVTAASGLLLAESEAEYRTVLDRFPQWPGGPYPLLNHAAWRMEQEPVKHKILDLLGDLALAELALPQAEIEIENGGHGINHLLLDRLQAARPSLRY